MNLKATILAGALLAAAATMAHATVLPYKSLDGLVSESDGIVIGTVRSIETPPGNRPDDLYTFVTIDQIEVLSGRVAEGRLTLRMKGGFDGQQGLHVDGAPQFQPNERVLLFVQGNGRDLVPFVGWSQGVFKLVQDANGKRRVQDAEGHSVLGVEGGHVMRGAGQRLETAVAGAPDIVRQRGAAPRASAGTADDGSEVKEVAAGVAAQAPMEAEQFIAEVRRRAGAGNDLRSVAPNESRQGQGNGQDVPAARAPRAEQPVAMPSGNGVTLPAQRKPPAGGQR